ncbi:MAG: peptidylprolyl isomerase [Vicingaceae bacterium]
MNLNKTILTICLIVTYFSLNAQVVLDEIIAVVGDEIVLKSDIETQAASYQSQGLIIREEDKCRILEDLLFQKLLINQAKLDSVAVTDGQVEGELNRRLNYFIQQVGSKEKLEEYYQKSIIEIKDEFRTVIKEQLLAQIMQGKITDGVRITPAEVKEYFKSIPEDSVPIVQSEVEVAQIIIKVKENKEAQDAAINRLNELRERIINGEDFATLAILYSEDPGSAKNGGELGFLGRAELVPEFSAVAFKLKNNKVSEVVKTEYGYHIMQLIERRGEKVNVRHILIKPKLTTEQVLKAKQLADSVYQLIITDSLTFDEAAQKFSDDKATKNNGGLVVNPQTGTSTWELDAIDPKIYVIIKNMMVGEVSKPVPTELIDQSKAYRIVKLLNKSPEHKATLETDYYKIQNAALAHKKQEALLEWINKKTQQTFISIKEPYNTCTFDNNWLE